MGDDLKDEVFQAEDLTGDYRRCPVDMDIQTRSEYEVASPPRLSRNCRPDHVSLELLDDRVAASLELPKKFGPNVL